MAARKTTAKKAPAKVQEVKAAAEATLEEVKVETAKVAEEVKAEAVKVAEEVKAAAKKAPAKRAPKKKAAVATVTVEFAGKQMTITDIAAKAEAAYLASHKDAVVETVDVYVKAEEGVAYYVVNGEGSADFKIAL